METPWHGIDDADECGDFTPVFLCGWCKTWRRRSPGQKYCDDRCRNKAWQRKQWERFVEKLVFMDDSEFRGQLRYILQQREQRRARRDSRLPVAENRFRVRY